MPNTDPGKYKTAYDLRQRFVLSRRHRPIAAVVLVIFVIVAAGFITSHTYATSSGRTEPLELVHGADFREPWAAIDQEAAFKSNIVLTDRENSELAGSLAVTTTPEVTIIPMPELPPAPLPSPTPTHR